MGCRTCPSLPYAEAELQGLAVARLPQYPLVQLPRRKETCEGVQRSEEYDALLVHVRQKIVEIRGLVLACIAQVDRPALQHDFIVATATSRRPRAGVRRRCQRVCNIPPLARIVDNDKSLVLCEMGSIKVYLDDERRRPIITQVWPFPFLEVVQQHIGLVEYDVELKTVSVYLLSANHDNGAKRRKELHSKLRGETNHPVAK